ncbi:MAG: 2,5-diamino-6-(ribosylamino)-4(3H)-pyrimidinone 5'-phosphate reductase [Crenarchaeota archaeon]|nr:2,5-diamino-6-(ribosylamino)-4(3H)-pyrimidinone 5'-phosphate reductase [Thermoproteota archaeon]
MEVVVFSSASLDGRIATREGDSKLSCEYDLALLHEWRCRSDAVLVGAGTAVVDDPGLFVKRVPCERQPLRGVVDGRLRVPHDLRLFREMPWLSLVITTHYGIRKEGWKAKYLSSRGVELIAAGDGPSVNWHKAIEELASRGIRRILVEGGGKTTWSLVKSNAVDRMEITYVGKVLGAGTPVVDGEGYATVREAPSFAPSEVRICPCGRCVHVTWLRIL